MKLHIGKKAKKALDEMQADRRKQIENAMKNLPDGDVKILQGKREPYKRLRVGSYRVIFKEKDDELYISKIEPRGDVYKGGF